MMSMKEAEVVTRLAVTLTVSLRETTESIPFSVCPDPAFIFYVIAAFCCDTLPTLFA